MKKILHMMVSLALLLSITACSTNRIDKDAQQLYDDAVKEISSLSSGNIAGKFLFSMDGMSVKLAFDALYNLDKKIGSMSLDAALSGVKVDDVAQLYYKGDIFYVNVMEEEKIGIPYELLKKAISDMADPETETKEAQPTDENTFAAEGIFDSMSYDKEKNTIHGIFRKDAYQEIITSANESLNSSSQDMNGITISVDSIKDFQMDMVLDENNEIAKLSIFMTCVYDMKTDDKSETIDLDMEYTFDFKEKNNVEEITFPDFETYTIQDEQSLDLNSLIQENQSTVDNII